MTLCAVICLSWRSVNILIAFRTLKNPQSPFKSPLDAFVVLEQVMVYSQKHVVLLLDYLGFYWTDSDDFYMVGIGIDGATYSSHTRPRQ